MVSVKEWTIDPVASSRIERVLPKHAQNPVFDFLVSAVIAALKVFTVFISPAGGSEGLLCVCVNVNMF